MKPRRRTRFLPDESSSSRVVSTESVARFCRPPTVRSASSLAWVKSASSAFREMAFRAARPLKKIAKSVNIRHREPVSGLRHSGRRTGHLLRVQCPTARSPSVSAWCTRPSWPSRRSATTVRPDPVVVSFYGIGSREQRAIVDGSRRAASAPRTRTRPRDAREVECLDTRATWRDRRASRANRGSSRRERPAASPGGAPRDGMDFVIFPATSA